MLARVAQQHAENTDRVGTDCATNRQKLDDVKPSLATFVFCHKRLGLSQFLAEFDLREFGAFPRPY